MGQPKLGTTPASLITAIYHNFIEEIPELGGSQFPRYLHSLSCCLSDALKP